MFRGYPVGQVCKSCASGCTSCEKNSTHCLSCEETLLLHKHECVERCPPGHTVRNGECVQCTESCVICSEDGLCTGEIEIHHNFVCFHELFFMLRKQLFTKMFYWCCNSLLHSSIPTIAVTVKNAHLCTHFPLKSAY